MACGHHRARVPGLTRGRRIRAGESLSMFGPSAASRRFLRLRRVLIGLQIAFLIFSMAAPIGTIAAEPSAPPSDTPSAAPTPDPTTAPTPDPTATPDPTPDPTAAP